MILVSKPIGLNKSKRFDQRMHLVGKKVIKLG
jgi:hypothetical protein